jgi:hypothetical protein
VGWRRSVVWRSYDDYIISIPPSMMPVWIDIVVMSAAGALPAAATGEEEGGQSQRRESPKKGFLFILPHGFSLIPSSGHSSNPTAAPCGSINIATLPLRIFGSGSIITCPPSFRTRSRVFSRSLMRM